MDNLNISSRPEKLRFWCQKVLPLVYDESLSYYELLAKVVKHLNDNTESINELIDFYNEIAGEIQEIVEQMIEDGDFNDIITATIGKMIADEYDEDNTYSYGDYCIHNAKLYEATDETTGTWNLSAWEEVNVTDKIVSITSTLLQVTTRIYNLNAGDISFDENGIYSEHTVGSKLKDNDTKFGFFLTSTNNTDDRTSDIQYLLNRYGIAFLGNGDFYIQNLAMPSRSKIIGSGKATRLILIGDSRASAIIPRSFCEVCNLTLYGGYDVAYSELTGNMGSRHGIEWKIDSSSTTPKKGVFSNLYITGFSGAGVYDADVGTNVQTGFTLNNCQIELCERGIYISGSEWVIATGTRFYHNYYAVEDNGANNHFVACDFSANMMGLVTNNASGQVSNIGHSGCTECMFNHVGITGSSYGNGIMLNGNHSGYHFIGCEFYFSNIQITNCGGIVFDSCNYGSDNTISITDCDLIEFNGCYATGSPTISASNSPLLKIKNCYLKGSNTKWSGYRELDLFQRLTRDTAYTFSIPSSSQTMIIIFGTTAASIILVNCGDTGNVVAVDLSNNEYITLDNSVQNQLTITQTSSSSYAYAYFMKMSGGVLPSLIT